MLVRAVRHLSYFSTGIDVVIDYLWGQSAKTAMIALAKTVEEKPVRFVHVGGASGELNIELPGAALRSAAIMLMGSGVGSVSRKGLCSRSGASSRRLSQRA
jgi:hypothetical protein